MYIRDRLKGERASENERPRVLGDAENAAKERKRKCICICESVYVCVCAKGDCMRECGKERRRDDENKRAVEIEREREREKAGTRAA